MLVPLHVRIEAAGNTLVKATISNTGASDIMVFRKGSILDESPTKKATAYSNGIFAQCPPHLVARKAKD